MEIKDHLDKIHKLGFYIDLEWNEGINIYYNANDVYPSTAYSVNIVTCQYYKSNITDYSYYDMIESVCDIFYKWYNDNLKIIEKFDMDNDPKSLEGLEDVCLKDVTKQVARDLNLSDILGL